MGTPVGRLSSFLSFHGDPEGGEGRVVAVVAAQVAQHRGETRLGLPHPLLDPVECLRVFGGERLEPGAEIVHDALGYGVEGGEERVDPLGAQQRLRVFVGKAFDGGLGLEVEFCSEALDFLLEILLALEKRLRRGKKSTGVVLLVVAVVSLIIWGIDTGLSAGITGLKKLATNDTSVSEVTDENGEVVSDEETADAETEDAEAGSEDEAEDATEAATEEAPAAEAEADTTAAE